MYMKYLEQHLAHNKLYVSVSYDYCHHQLYFSQEVYTFNGTKFKSLRSLNHFFFQSNIVLAFLKLENIIKIFHKRDIT